MADQWQPGISVVIPAKRLPEAKSRLDLPPSRRQHVALGLLLATTTAAMRAARVDRVYVITRDHVVASAARTRGATPIVEQSPFELNAAIRQGRRTASERHPESPVAVLLGDLAFLDPTDLDAAIAYFHKCGDPLMVPDRDGTGTTFLIHRQGNVPPTAFGAASAAAHRECGFVETGHELESLRTDVDAVDDMDDVMLCAMEAAGRQAMYSSDNSVPRGTLWA